MIFVSLSILLLFKTIASLNDIKKSVSYYLYLYINVSPYKLASAIATGGGGVAIVWEN
jgi:hypothetical protein